MERNQKIALITGATSGIGKATVLKLAAVQDRLWDMSALPTHLNSGASS